MNSVKVKELMKSPKPMLWYYRISRVQNEGKLKEKLKFIKYMISEINGCKGR
jgi:hypothetical protein